MAGSPSPMSEQDQYADWTSTDIGVLLTHYEVEWEESLPWPILELVQRFVSGRLVDREAIDQGAGISAASVAIGGLPEPADDSPIATAFLAGLAAAIGDTE